MRWRTTCRACVHESTALAAECDRLRDAIAKARTEHAAIDADRNHIRHRLDDVLQSKSWRWTQPVRNLLGRLKVP